MRAIGMVKKMHVGLTQERWNRFSLTMQLANVGCDVDRAICARAAGNMYQSGAALMRALELLDMTIADPKCKGLERQGLMCMREVLKDHFWGGNEYGSTDKWWQDYFYAFGYAAAVERGFGVRSSTSG